MVHDSAAACIALVVTMLPLPVEVMQIQEAHTSEAMDVLAMVGAEGIEIAACVLRALVQMEDTDKATQDALDMIALPEEVDEPAEAVYCTFPVAEAVGNTHCMQVVR